MPEYRVRATNLDGLGAFTRGYLECAEWAGPLDEELDALELSVAPRWSDEAREQAIVDCRDFQTANANDLGTYDPAGAGLLFWLTRNRHGAGYWDGAFERAAGARLTANAHAYGEVNVFYDADTETLSFG